MPCNSKNTDTLDNKPDPVKEPQIEPPPTDDSGLETKRRMVVIGIYGLPGSGKPFLLDQLRSELGEEYSEFYDGSRMIFRVRPGGLAVFQILEESEKRKWRQLAIESVPVECADIGRVAIVAGHFMFWSEKEEE